jgi:lysozyme
VDGLHIAGNYAFDTLNNAYEVAAVSSGAIARNIGWNAGGNSIVEMWALCSSITVEGNRGYNDPLASRRLSSSYHNGGVWRTNYADVTGATSDDAKSGGNIVRFNYIQDPGANGVDVLGGAGDSYCNNTIVSQRQGWGNGWYVRGAGASGHSLTNNLFVNAAPGASFVFFGQIDAGVAPPTRVRRRLAKRRGPILRHRQLADGERRGSAFAGDPGRRRRRRFWILQRPFRIPCGGVRLCGPGRLHAAGLHRPGGGAAYGQSAHGYRWARDPKSRVARHRLSARMSAMPETDDLLTQRLIRHEGLRLKPYRDTAGKLTIGVGRNLDDAGVSRIEAMLLLKNDIDHVRAVLDERWPWWRKLDAVRGDVMVELVFNLGPDGLAAFRSVLFLLETAAYAAAANDILTTKWAKEVGERAKELAKMIATGIAT